MKNQEILMKEKLGFSGIIKEATNIFAKAPCFIFLTFLTSLPLFFSILVHEAILQQILMEAIQILTYKEAEITFSVNGHINFHVANEGLDRVAEVVRKACPKFLVCCMLYLGSVHVLDLLSTIILVGSSSQIYAQESSVNLKEMLFGTVKKVGFQGPFITSMYALLLASITSIGLLTLATNLYLVSNTTRAALSGTFFICLLGTLFIALLIKHVEWSAIWNMGLVVSVLEEKHGYVAIGVSAYISRGNRKLGFLLMLVFFVWRVVLRPLCVYMCWYKKGCAMMIMVTTGLACLGHVMKWVVFVVYFYDCKKRFLEKKIDAEEGKTTNSG